MAIQLTNKGWTNGKSKNWSNRNDKVKAKRRGITQSSRVKSFTLAGDDVIDGTAKNISGLSIGGDLKTQAGNDSVIGTSSVQSGLYNEGLIDTGRENDTIKGVSRDSRGLENQGDIYTQDGADLIIGTSERQEGISNSGTISMAGGNDTLRGSGLLAGLRNDGYISMGTGSDRVDVLNGGFSGNGYLDLGPGFDTVIGFGAQTVDGGGDRDTLLLAKGRYTIADNTDPWGNTFGKAITDRSGTTMVAANMETIGSALSGEQVALTNGTLLINAMGEVSYL
jgi:hypothetical protein